MLVLPNTLSWQLRLVARLKIGTAILCPLELHSVHGICACNFPSCEFPLETASALTAARRAGLRELLSADTGGRLKVTSVGLKVFERQAAQVRRTRWSR